MTNKTLLVVQSYAGARNQVHWAWDSFKLPGWDILGTTPEDSQHDWPKGIQHILPVGQDGYLNEAMIRRWVKLFDVLATGFHDYTDFFVTEYDSAFLSNPPVGGPSGLFTRLGGGPVTGSKAKQFFHPPWWVSRYVAGVIARVGNDMIREKQWELYSPDFFLGRLVDITGLPWSEGNTWSCNGNNLKDRRPDAEKAVRNGAWFVHGLRTKDELNWLNSIKP